MVLFLVIYIGMALLVLADQLIKVWAVNNLMEQGSIPFLKIGDFDWMHLTYLENRGAAFSMLSGSRAFLIAFPIVMTAACLYLMHRRGKRHRWLYLSLPLIVAGGIGNLIDRIFRGGAVVDYLDFQLTKFAVFNFADCCVTVGVIIMIFAILFLENELPDAKKLKRAERMPYAHTYEEAGTLPEAGELPEAGTLPEAEALPEAPPAELRDAPSLLPEVSHAE
ncbi:MAG: signal peptidase II [Oscillospiraceae bacterium]|nr:signal peptidase II [Oscillospiraceae bacterium]